MLSPRNLTFAYIAALGVLIVGLDVTEAGARLLSWVHGVPGLDKLGHFVIMGTFSLLLNVAWRLSRIRVGSRSLLKGTLAVCAFALFEELSQLFFAGRVFSLTDLASDFAGAFVAGWLVVLWYERPS